MYNINRCSEKLKDSPSGSSILDVPLVVGTQLCRLSPVDAHTVYLKPLMGK